MGFCHIKQILNYYNPNIFYDLFCNLDSCIKHPVFVHLIVDCNGAYSIQDQDSKDYNFGWKPYNKTENDILGKGERPVVHRGNIDPWLYSSKFKTYHCVKSVRIGAILVRLFPHSD